MWVNSLLFIQYSVKIEGCIICNNANIHEKASMKDCDVAGGYIVDKDSKLLRYDICLFFLY
jgi:ADP-glucose pyrophosphorylase